MEDESNNPDIGTAEFNINDAVEYLNGRDDTPEDSTVEQPEGSVDAPSIDETPTEEISVEEPEETYFDIDGEQVSLSEIRASYMRNAAFTQKSQAINEERRQFQANMRDINEVRTQALQGIEYLKQELYSHFVQMDQPDLEFLAENDPGEYIRQKHIWDKKEAAVRKMWEAEQHLRAEKAAYEEQVHQNAIRESNARLVERYPEFKDPVKSDIALRGMASLLGEYQFTGEELGSISDHRMISLVYDFLQLREKHQSVPHVVAKIEQKPAISVKNPSRKKTTDAGDAAYAKFNKSLSVNDAIAYLNSR